MSSKYCIAAIDTPHTVNEAGCLAIFGFRLGSSDVSSTNMSCKNMFLSLQERVLIFYICGKFNLFLHPEILQAMLNWSRSDGTSSIRIDAGCPERTASRIPHSSRSKSDRARFSWKQTLKNPLSRHLSWRVLNNLVSVFLWRPVCSNSPSQR